MLEQAVQQLSNYHVLQKALARGLAIKKCIETAQSNLTVVGKHINIGLISLKSGVKEL
jgi:hypothetical protein